MGPQYYNAEDTIMQAWSTDTANFWHWPQEKKNNQLWPVSMHKYLNQKKKRKKKQCSSKYLFDFTHDIKCTIRKKSWYIKMTDGNTPPLNDNIYF